MPLQMPSAAISPPPEVAVYDLDRTLTDGGSWLPFLTFWLRHEAPWRAILLPLVALGGLAFGLKLIPRGAIKAWAHRWLIGRRVSEARLTAAAARFADGFVIRHALPAAAEALARDAAAGRRLVIASASHSYYVHAIAARMGIADVVATEAVRRDGRVYSDLAGPNCYGAAKRAALEAWLAREGLDDAVVHFTSDHHSDLPCFELAVERGGTVTCANADAALVTIAVERGWPVVQWGTLRRSFFERA
ncbi:MAG: hypothetical protein RIS17_316 [Pseudomonadota bacterium]|jgi:HAD superfamily phosphoserine phosphatase-like hydrolase